MTAARARSIFFPYIFGDETLRVELSGCSLDGKVFDAKWDAESSQCDLSVASSWDSGSLQFKISREPGAMWVSDLVPTSERKSPPVTLVGTAHCGPTFQRYKCEGTLDIKGESGTLDVTADAEGSRGLCRC